MSAEFGPGKRSSLENFIMVFSNRPSILPQNRVSFPRGGLLHIETLTEENLLIKDQNHPEISSYDAFHVATGAGGLDSSLDLGGTTSFFQERDGEVGEKEAKLRLAGRAGFNCNFMSLHLRALLKFQYKIFIFWVYF